MATLLMYKKEGEMSQVSVLNHKYWMLHNNGFVRVT